MSLSLTCERGERRFCCCGEHRGWWLCCCNPAGHAAFLRVSPIEPVGLCKARCLPGSKHRPFSHLELQRILLPRMDGWTGKGSGAAVVNHALPPLPRASVGAQPLLSLLLKEAVIKRAPLLDGNRKPDSLVLPLSSPSLKFGMSNGKP